MAEEAVIIRPGQPPEVKIVTGAAAGATIQTGRDRVVVVDRPAQRIIVRPSGGKEGPPGSRVVEISFSIMGDTSGEELLLRYQATSPMTINPNLCAASTEELVDAVRVVSATLDGQPFASITFEPSSLDAVFTFEPGVLDAPMIGLLRVYGPELTLSDFAITFSGER